MDSNSVAGTSTVWLLVVALLLQLDAELEGESITPTNRDSESSASEVPTQSPQAFLPPRLRLVTCSAASAPHCSPKTSHSETELQVEVITGMSERTSATGREESY